MSQPEFESPDPPQSFAPASPSAPVRVQSISRGHTAGVPTMPSQVVHTSVQHPVVDVGTAVGATAPTLPKTKGQRLFETWKKIGGGSLMVSLLIHVGLLIAAVFVVQTIVHEDKVDFLSGGGSKSASDASQSLQQQVQNKKRHTMQRSVPMQRVVVNSEAATIRLPDMEAEMVDVPETSSLLSAGTLGSGGFSTAGIGGGSGTGMGIGNMKSVTFFGFSTKANRIAFLVDYSGSMSGEFRLTMEAELEKSLKALPNGTEVLIIPWAGGAWLYDQKASEIKDKWEKLTDYDNFAIIKGKKLKKPEWVPINTDNVKKLMKGVLAQEQWPGGTDWRSPFNYAMEANPPPDSIFFLTDGQIMTPERALEAIDVAMQKAKKQPSLFALWIVNKTSKPDTMKTLVKRYKGEFREVGGTAPKKKP